MKEINAMLLCDGYKLAHHTMYNQLTEIIYSNFTPRSNRHLPEVDKVVTFGVQYFIKRYLIEYFNENFFNRRKEDVITEYSQVINEYLGDNNVGISHIEELYDLGYLPIEIKSLPEGTVSPIGVPVLTINNTLPKFFWLTNYLETILSNILWHPITSASIARVFKKNLMKHALKTGFDKMQGIDFLIHDFSMRGMSGLESTIISGMAHLTSFVGSESIPSIVFAKEYYGAGANKEIIAGTVPASEHSVACNNAFSYGGQLIEERNNGEFEYFKHLITNVFPNGFISLVSDTFDYWLAITDFLPRLKEDIMHRNGRVVIRPDSGDPVKIICGYYYQNISKLEDVDDSYEYAIYNNLVYKVSDIREYINAKRYDDITSIKSSLTIAEVKGTYEYLWDIFGGTINEKGYKVLDNHIGMIYGDAITLERQKEIYKELEIKGFAATNIVLGVGSYSYLGKISRDSLGCAVKATWSQVNGKHIDMFKDPKTVIGMSKKSLRGLIKIYKNDNGELYAIDKIKYNDYIQDDTNNMLRTVFKDGKLINETTLAEIRQNVNNSL